MLSNDALAMVMLCSRLGLEKRDTDTKPLNLRQWNELARKIQNSDLRRPGSLLGVSAENLVSELAIEFKNSEAISKLLDRAGSIAIELERLESLGICVLTRADTSYPDRYKSRLKGSAPPVLFYAGEIELLGQKGIAVVGSRDVDEAGIKSASWIGNACGLSGMVLYSGGAKGVDTISMKASIEARGFAVGVMADKMEKAIRIPEYRKAIQDRNICIMTPYLPSASFNVGLAMGRNKLIYTLADYGIVIASAANKGGTWSGAVENLKHDWVPLFVISCDKMPEGNKALLKQGGIRLPISNVERFSKLEQYLEEAAASQPDKPSQPSLF